MIKSHEPFQDGSKHAMNEYCPSCHGAFDPNLWDQEGHFRPESQVPGGGGGYPITGYQHTGSVTFHGGSGGPANFEGASEGGKSGKDA